MNHDCQVVPGTWVEVQQTVLTPSERAPQIPDDTKEVPYVLRVSGFLVAGAKVGDEVTVRTLIGRTVKGTLTVVNPSYRHSFGNTIPEILPIGTEAERP